MEPGPSTSPMEQREEFIIDSDALKDCIITGLKEMYFSQMLYDVTIRTTEKCFQCHRVVLASVSDYFRALFMCSMKETVLGEVCLLEVPSTVLQTILHYIYTGELHLTLDNVEELFIVSGRLQITALQDLCSRYLAKGLNNGNCLSIYRLAHGHHHRNLSEEAVNYIGQNLSSVSVREDFMIRLQMEELVNILSSDSLMVSSELAVYNIARCWWEFHTQKDHPLPLELFRVVRLALMTPDELEKVSRDIPSDDYLLQLPERVNLRQGMFEERITGMEIKLLDRTDPEEEDYYFNAYDPTTESWEKLPFCDDLDQPGIAAVGCKLYVSGGFHEERHASNALHVYDSVFNEWQELPPMTYPRACHGFLAYKNMLYAFGGCNRTDLVDSMECFSLSDNRWRNLSSMPLALRGFACAELKGRLFAIGGMTRSDTEVFHHPGFHIYNISTDTWSQFPLPIIFSAAGVVTMDDKLYVVVSCKLRHDDFNPYPGYDTYSPFNGYDSYLLYNEDPEAISRGFILDHLGRICHGTIPPVVESVSHTTVVRWEDRIYVMGGIDEECMSIYTMLYWSPGKLDWTVCRKELPFLISDFGSVTLQVPLKHLTPLIPGRRLDYIFKSYSGEDGTW
ncbi:kelch-like protein 41 [Rana temporaria]|uniref:kelch-like protein 41 n=1 Tax=Rana temporaria TaxID=8407 RepID=UPI001AAD13D0|nr:kelch-like protein 41 [Rana temporaria]